jgi:hypothetical protein
MLEQLANLVKQFSGDAVVNNPDIPNEHNENVMAEATSSISGGLQNAIAGGGLQNVLGLLTGGGGNGGSGIMGNSLVQSMVGSFAGKLLSKYGISPQIAGPLATSLIPKVLNGLISKTNDSNDSSFNLQGILSSLTGQGGQQQAGGGGFDIAGILSSLTGGGQQQQQAQSGGGLQDIIAKFTGGALEQRGQQAQQGGLFDIVKGFLK